MSNNIYVDSVPSLDGWLVKWNNSFRDYIGICIKTVCDSPEVYLLTNNRTAAIMKFLPYLRELQ